MKERERQRVMTNEDKEAGRRARMASITQKGADCILASHPVALDDGGRMYPVFDQAFRMLQQLGSHNHLQCGKVTIPSIPTVLQISPIHTHTHDL